jgi:hypothetical protein
MATEEAPYKVLKADDIFEVREYAPHILAEIVVDGDLEGAGSKAFRRLFRYIQKNGFTVWVNRSGPVTIPLLPHGLCVETRS